MNGSKRSSDSFGERLQRLEAAVGGVVVSPPEAICSEHTMIAITSSRLGHDCQLHRRVCRFLTQSMLRCRHRDDTMLVAAGSAIENWAKRAAELFAIPLQVISVDHSLDADIEVQSSVGQSLSRDAVLIALADRVDAVYVRRGGMIDQCLKNRVSQRQDVTTRVAISLTSHCAAPALIAAGAIGWYVPQTDEHRIDRSTIDLVSHTQSDDCWTHTDGEWLVHCTRGCRGAWPGETQRQYCDWMLLAGQASSQRGPLETLSRILRSGILMAATGGTKKSNPVVCFSALPLRELLQQRCFRPHLGRWDYEPYGVAIRVSAAKRIGIQPVIYGPPEQRKTLARADRFRFHPVGTTYDWRREQEWRSPIDIDLGNLDAHDVRVFVEHPADLANLATPCPWPITVLNQ